MELNLFINIFKKEPGNIPPQAGNAQGRRGGEQQGKRQTEHRFFIFFCLIFCFLLSIKTRKARKSSQFGIPNTTTLEEYKAFASCSLLASQQTRTAEDNADVRSHRDATNRSSPIGQLHKLGVILLVWVTCNFLSHTNASLFLTMKTQIRS